MPRSLASDTTFGWAMKKSVLRLEHDDWKVRKTKSHDEERNRYIQTAFTDDNQIRIMASLVPDEIIYNIDNYSNREMDACFLFGDVSGFTDLCEKYNKSGKGGPSRLTQVLNAYIGAMVQEILSHSGDVLKFSGDAFLAIWKETDHLSLKDAVHEGIDCSLVIQKSYGIYQTDVDVVVRVKLVVACGHVTFSLIGNEENSHYLMVGKPILDIKMAENVISAGEIVISARVSHHLNANEYLIDILPDNMHAKILGVGPNWRNIQRRYETKSAPMESLSVLSGQMEGSLASEEFSTHSDYKEASPQEEEETYSFKLVNDQYALRPAVNHAARKNIKNELRKFIIAPVMHGIQANEPIEYLTEIRQVCILFINIKVSANLNVNANIDIANEVYLSVCHEVKGKYGCVNKISNFDKDLMLLVIFGLRGFKHELESQMALISAISCFENLSKMNDISGVATAVTTGKCYCGAFGHALRREYTVIGGIVNKAARLMMAYPNKVTCDRETFLHSKLEPRNFVLQQSRALKGISNPGPIYQFKGIKESSREIYEVMNLPLLGRDHEINLFYMLYKKAKKLIDSKSGDPFHSMLVFKGTFRQGKTRVLEEIIFITREIRYVKKYSFWSYDSNVPYKAIKKIFYKFFRIPPKERENRKQKAILPFLNKAKIAADACFLNIVFDVNFPFTSKFTNMDSDNKYKTLQLLFKRLCRSVFDKCWLLLMDDIQYIDDESWLLLNFMIEQQQVFIVGTMGVEIISPLVRILHMNAKIKVVKLKAIDKWYHVGLACQMLQVGGIPPELEKTIQLKSSGNPGWIESFLVSTLQSGGLGLVEMTREKAYEAGIVIPPLYTVMRLSKEEIKVWVEIMEERLTSVTDDRVSTRWKMFVDSCRDSFPNLAVAKEFDNLAKNSDLLKICVLNKDFNLEDVDPELAIDVIILKTFDALTSYEQLLLKCSSVLGDIFPRNMLTYIMSTSAVRTTALAVKKLFEIHVLSCARGNFIEGGLDFNERLNNPNENLSVKCECRGLLIDESCQDLPKYALCGYMRFRSSEFRETTYNLLTENQKRDLHEKAIRYLEKDARRCRACGNGYFTRQLGTGRIDPTLRMKKKEKRSLLAESLSFQEGLSVTKFLTRYSLFSLDSLRSSFTASNAFKFRDSNRHKDPSIFSGSNEQDHMLSTISYEIGMRAVRKLKDNFNLVRTFSTSDFSNCTCLQVLNTLYSDLIDHCKGAGHAEKILSVTAEYAYVCIENNNAPYAIKILEEALELLEGPLKDQIELDWMVDLRKGKLYTILGQARMEIDDDQALAYFKEALNRYGLKYPKTVGGRNVLKHILKLKHRLKYTLGYNIFSRDVDDIVKEYNNNLSECLGCLCQYYMKKNRWMEAELMAIWSLTKAVITESDFEKLCMAYGNAIMTETLLNHFKFAEILEIYALRNCHMKKSYVELDELKSVTYLYYAISLRRVIRGEIEKFLHISHLLWRLSASCRSENLLFRTLPLIAYVILTKRQIDECVHVIQEIRYIAETDVDNSEKCWYYALCMLVHLESSLTVEAFSECLKFAQDEGMEATSRDMEGKRQLLACIWLREIRLENWESAVVWQKFVWNFRLKETGETIANYVTSLYLLEGLIIYLCHKMDRKNMKCVNKAINKITEIFECLDKTSKYNKFIQPRLLHMKAYYKIVRFNDYKGGLKMMLKAKITAETNLNDLEMYYLKHTEKAWLKKLNREEMDFWRDHADDLNLISVGDPDFLEKINHYSLPLPLYI